MRTKNIMKKEIEPNNRDIRVLVLNASLKHKGKLSNTGELAGMVLKFIRSEEKNIMTDVIRLSDINIPPGIKFRESRSDKWPQIAEKMINADIVIFATPIWWGSRSSLIQRIIERMDSFDEEYKDKGRSLLLNKAAGVIITGSEDGAQATLGSILSVLTFMNFTIPPECCTYWVGEVGKDPVKDRQKRLKNSSTKKMAQKMAHSLLHYARILRKYPMHPAF